MKFLAWQNNYMIRSQNYKHIPYYLSIQAIFGGLVRVHASQTKNDHNSFY